MIEIKRLRRLKYQQQRLLQRYDVENPLALLNPDYVSDSGLTVEDLAEKIEKIKDCATIIELTEHFEKVGDTFEQVMSVSAANYCKQPAVCPVCASRLQSRRKARFSDVIREQAEMCNESYIDKFTSEERKKRYAYMVTYTVTDGDSLAERLEHLKESKRNWRRMGQRRSGGKRSGGEAGKVKAAIDTVEIKRGKYSGQWHVHIHSLVFTDERLDYRVYDPDLKKSLEKKYGRKIPEDVLLSAALYRCRFRGKLVSASKISDEWIRATGGDSIDIRVDPIRHVPKKAKGKKKRMFEKMSFVESVLYQAKECLKYPFKPNDVSVADSLEILCDTYNKRMVDCYGEFRGIGGDDFNVEPDLEKNSFVAVWDKGRYGTPVPGTVRELDDESATEARRKVGRAYGRYRRARREILDKRDTVEDLDTVLNQMKRGFRFEAARIWIEYHERKKQLDLIRLEDCDKYFQLKTSSGTFYSPERIDPEEIFLAGWQ